MVQQVHDFSFMLCLLTREANDEEIPSTFLSNWKLPLSPMSLAI